MNTTLQNFVIPALAYSVVSFLVVFAGVPGLALYIIRAYAIPLFHPDMVETGMTFMLLYVLFNVAYFIAFYNATKQ